MIRRMIYIPEKKIRDFSKDPFVAKYLQSNENDTFDVFYNGKILTLTNNKNVYPFDGIDQNNSITIFIKDGESPAVYYNAPPEDKCKEILWYFGQWTKSRTTRNINVYNLNKESSERKEGVKLLEIKEGNLKLLYKIRDYDIKRVKAYVPEDCKVEYVVSACKKLIKLSPKFPVWKFEVMGVANCWYNPTVKAIYSNDLTNENIEYMKELTLKKLDEYLI